MSGNLSCIGFSFPPEVLDEAFAGAVERMAHEATERLSCPPGDYAIWRSRTGAEVWVHLAAENDEGQREIVGLTPFFEGRSEIPVRITEPFQRSEDNDFEGAWSLWIAPDENGDGSYPAIVDAVDWGARNSIVAPCTTTMRIACFARELAAFDSERAFLASPLRQVDLAPQAFIPLGLFASAEADSLLQNATDTTEPVAPPSSTALLTGRVVEHATLINEMMGLPFEWLLVESLDATYDVVADPAIVTGTIAIGGTVQIACWMVGRTLEAE